MVRPRKERPDCGQGDTSSDRSTPFPIYFDSQSWQIANAPTVQIAGCRMVDRVGFAPDIIGRQRHHAEGPSQPVARSPTAKQGPVAAIVLDHERRTRKAAFADAKMTASAVLTDSIHQDTAQIATNGATVTNSSNRLRAVFGVRYRDIRRVHSEALHFGSVVVAESVMAMGRPIGAHRYIVQASAMLVALSRPSRPASTSKVTF